MTNSGTTAASVPRLSIVVISLARAGQRRERLRSELETLGFFNDVTWFDAVDGLTLGDEDVRLHCSTAGYLNYKEHSDEAYFGSITRGALACALSWKAVLARVARPTLVLEDDAVFHDEFVNRFQVAWRDVPPDWELIYLSCNSYWPRWIGPQLTSCVLRVAERLHGTGALIVHPEAVPKLLSLFPLDLQLDHDLPDRLIMPGRLKAYLLTFRGEPLVKNDNLDGTYTQFATSPDSNNPSPGGIVRRRRLTR